MGRFGQVIIYFWEKWGRFGRSCFGSGDVKTDCHDITEILLKVTFFSMKLELDL
jgi:hypothetical protein